MYTRTKPRTLLNCGWTISSVFQNSWKSFFCEREYVKEGCPLLSTAIIGQILWEENSEKINMQKVYHSCINNYRSVKNAGWCRGKNWCHCNEDLSWTIRSPVAKMALHQGNWAFLFYIDQSLDASYPGKGTWHAKRRLSLADILGSWGNECFRTAVKRMSWTAYLNVYQNHLAPLKSICLVPVLGTTPLGFWWTSFPGGKLSRGRLIG